MLTLRLNKEALVRDLPFRRQEIPGLLLKHFGPAFKMSRSNVYRALSLRNPKGPIPARLLIALIVLVRLETKPARKLDVWDYLVVGRGAASE